MRLFQQALHSLVDLHFLYLLRAHRAQLAIGNQLSLLLLKLGVLVAKFESCFVVLVDQIIKEKREFLETAGCFLRCDADDILTVGDEKGDEFLAESNKGV